VRFYTVENERTARWSCVWGLFFILLLYWAAPAMAAFGVDLFGQTQGAGAYAESGGMSGAEGDVIVVLAAQFASLPPWFVGLVAAGAMAAAIATTAGLFITASSAVAHDIYTELVNPDATQRQQVLIGRLTIVAIGALVTVTAFNPPALIGELVAYAFSLAGTVLFPMFFLGLWWENTNRQGALAGMTVGLLLWITSIFNSVLPKYVGFLADIAGGSGQALVPVYAQYVPPIGAALVGTPLVFLVTIAVSLATPEPPLETKRLVRQCHSPEPMGQQQTAEDIAATDGGPDPADD
jgi:cation/acetate symporter